MIAPSTSFFNLFLSELVPLGLLSLFSAIVEHTKQVIFLEDDDVAVIENGC